MHGECCSGTGCGLSHRLLVLERVLHKVPYCLHSCMDVKQRGQQVLWTMLQVEERQQGVVGVNDPL